MAVGSVLIGLQASRKDGRGVRSFEFIEPLAIQDGEVQAMRADGGPWTSGMVYFAVINHSDFELVDKSKDAGAQTEAFFASVNEAFLKMSDFLNQRPIEIFAAMRDAGLSVRLFIEIRMNQDQMELELPSELLGACGRAGVGVYVISNDIPAHEV